MKTKKDLIKKVAEQRCEVKLYKKRPIIVEAWIAPQKMTIKTLEGNMTANKGDFIIRGINGELYPCKPDIFNKTYSEIVNKIK